MSVRPVDLLTMLPRLGEASRLQHNAQTQPFVAQHAAAVQFVDKAIKERQQVHQRSPVEEATIRQDAKEKSSGGREQQRSRKGKDREPVASMPSQPPRPGNRLDVKL